MARSGESLLKECPVCGGFPPNCPGKHDGVDEEEELEDRSASKAKPQKEECWDFTRGRCLHGFYCRYSHVVRQEPPEKLPICPLSVNSPLAPHAKSSVPCSPPKSHPLSPERSPPKRPPASPSSERRTPAEADFSLLTPPKSQPPQPSRAPPADEAKVTPTLLAASGATPKPSCAKALSFQKASADRVQSEVASAKKEAIPWTNVIRPKRTILKAPILKTPIKPIKPIQKLSKSSPTSSESDEQVCQKFLKGICEWGDRCHRLHTTGSSASAESITQDEAAPTSGPTSSTWASVACRTAGSPSVSRELFSTEATCNSGHVLQLREAHEPSSCNSCHCVLIGLMRWRCEACDYNLCHMCNAKAVKSTQTEATLQSTSVPEATSKAAAPKRMPMKRSTRLGARAKASASKRNVAPTSSKPAAVPPSIDVKVMRITGFLSDDKDASREQAVWDMFDGFNATRVLDTGCDVYVEFESPKACAKAWSEKIVWGRTTLCGHTIRLEFNPDVVQDYTRLTETNVKVVHMEEENEKASEAACAEAATPEVEAVPVANPEDDSDADAAAAAFVMRMRAAGYSVQEPNGEDANLQKLSQDAGTSGRKGEPEARSKDKRPTVFARSSFRSRFVARRFSESDQHRTARGIFVPRVHRRGISLECADKVTDEAPVCMEPMPASQVTAPPAEQELSLAEKLKEWAKSALDARKAPAEAIREAVREAVLSSAVPKGPCLVPYRREVQPVEETAPVSVAEGQEKRVPGVVSKAGLLPRPKPPMQPPPEHVLQQQARDAVAESDQQGQHQAPPAPPMPPVPMELQPTLVRPNPPELQPTLIPVPPRAGMQAPPPMPQAPPPMPPPPPPPPQAQSPMPPPPPGAPLQPGLQASSCSSSANAASVSQPAVAALLPSLDDIKAVELACKAAREAAARYELMAASMAAARSAAERSCGGSPHCTSRSPLRKPRRSLSRSRSWRPPKRSRRKARRRSSPRRSTSDERGEDLRRSWQRDAPGMLTVPVDDLFFTHDSIARRFRDGRPLQQLIDELCSGHIDPLQADFLILDTCSVNGKLMCINNRRLFCMREFQKRTQRKLFLRVRITEIVQPGALKLFQAWTSKAEEEEVPVRNYGHGKYESLIAHDLVREDLRKRRKGSNAGDGEASHPYHTWK